MSKKRKQTDEQRRANGWQPYEPVQCDLCGDIAVWKHSKGGFRCAVCKCPGEDKQSFCSCDAPSRGAHTCPYKAEIYNDDSLCTCCRTCEGRCAEEI